MPRTAVLVLAFSTMTGAFAVVKRHFAVGFFLVGAGLVGLLAGIGLYH
ncbi:MAG: hypothetical protein WKF32_00730 [Thermoleophilaceae bacterium]